MNSKHVMVALDNMDKEKCFSFLKRLPEELPLVKIGLEMFNRYGASFVREVATTFQKRIFLDLKLHDIPNTVEKAILSLEGLPIDFLTVHLSGGRAMLEACQRARNKAHPNLNILGVSFLTSLGNQDFKELFDLEPSQQKEAFRRLFALAQETHTQGIVCSPLELEILESYPQLMSVCPGIRFQDEIDQGNIGDQQRVLSPKSAFEAGANYLVMGRSLTQANDLQQRTRELNS